MEKKGKVKKMLYDRKGMKHWNKSTFDMCVDIQIMPERCKKLGFKIDPNDLTLAEINVLGFGIWDKNSPLKLIPVWLLPFLKEDFECESINGKKISKLKDIDSDQRSGFLAYGVIPKDEDSK